MSLQPAQVDEQFRIQGYASLLCLCEIWLFKTAFSGWYAKSFVSVAMPILESWYLDTKHVPRRN